MTDSEMEAVVRKLADYMDANSGTSVKAKKKKSRKGLYSKVIVALCISLAVGYTGICLLMQWMHGRQPEPQLTIAFFAFVATELWSLSKIKRSKNENGEK